MDFSKTRAFSVFCGRRAASGAESPCDQRIDGADDLRPAHEHAPIARAFNTKTKYVATNSLKELTWQNSVILRGNAAAEVLRLKQQSGPDLLIQGSSVLIQTLLANDLIDELKILIFPLVLGPGKRLFGEGAKPAALTLVDSKTSTTGVTINTYHPAGAINPGSFAFEKPTDAEMARREKMKRQL